MSVLEISGIILTRVSGDALLLFWIPTQAPTQLLYIAPTSLLLVCYLDSGEAGGAGHGLPRPQWADNRRPGAASARFPRGSTSGCVEPGLPDAERVLAGGSGLAGRQDLCVLLHHHGAESLPDGAAFLHDVCGRADVQAGVFLAV